MSEPRNGFVFYQSWWTAIVNLPRDIQGEVLTAIIEYGLYGETTDNLKPIARTVLELVKPQIDANNTKYENGKKGAEYGKLGGRPNKSETPKKPQQNPKKTPEKPLKNKDKDKVEDKSSPPIPPEGVGGGCGWREELSGKFFSKKVALESFCMSNRIDTEELRKLASEIFYEWELASETDLTERHLINSLRVKIKIKHETDQRKQDFKTSGASGGLRSKLPPAPGYGLIED